MTDYDELCVRLDEYASVQWSPLCVREAAAAIRELRGTNHLEIVLPPFGHSFTLPTERLDMQALEWMREHCVIVTRDEWERLRVLLTNLSNEAGACSGMTGAREFLGNTNLACLELRVREAREWLASIDAARAADSADGVKP